MTREEGDPLKIAVALFEGAEELDWAGPWEIFAAWAERWPQDDVEVFTVGEDDRPIRCAKGLRVLADRTWPADGRIDVDVLLYPGGRGTLPQLGDDAIRARVRELADAGTLKTSVCTGSLVYADAGLLDGRPATTHWDSIHLLGPLGNAIDVRDEERFVDAGPVVTAAGVTAGIDMERCTSSGACIRSSGAAICAGTFSTTLRRLSDPDCLVGREIVHSLEAARSKSPG